MKKLSLWATVFFSLALVPTTVSAEPDCVSDGGVHVTVGTNGFSKLCAGGANPVISLVNGVANWVTGIIGVLVILIIVISGVQMITSAGNPDAIKAARTRLVNGVIGLALLGSMRAILNFIFKGSPF